VGPASRRPEGPGRRGDLPPDARCGATWDHGRRRGPRMLELAVVAVIVRALGA